MIRSVVSVVVLACTLLASALGAARAQLPASSTPEMAAVRVALDILYDVPRLGFDPRVYKPIESEVAAQGNWPNALLRRIASLKRVIVAPRDSLNYCETPDRCAFRGVGAIISISRPVVTGTKAVVHLYVGGETAPNTRRGQYGREFRIELERKRDGWRGTKSELRFIS